MTSRTSASPRERFDVATGGPHPVEIERESWIDAERDRSQ